MRPLGDASATQTHVIDVRNEKATSSMTETPGWTSPSQVAATSLDAALRAARPVLLECGGKQRRYLVCRDEAEEAEIKSQLHDLDEVEFTTIREDDVVPMLIHEAQDIELDSVVKWLDSLTGDDGKIGDRLASPLRH